MRVIRLPSGEEHRETRNERRECSSSCWSVTHRCYLEKAGERAVEGIDTVAVKTSQISQTQMAVSSTPITVLEKLTQPAGRACSPCLFAVYIVHSRIPIARYCQIRRHPNT